MKKQFTILLIIIFVFGILLKVNAEILTPNISSIIPTSFTAGETINIIGENFGNFEKGGYYNRVCFGFGEGEIVSWNNDQINVKVPDSVYYINYGNDIGIYTIQNNASYGTSCGSAEGIRSNYFTNYVIKSKINSVYPNEVMVGDTLTINGEGFGYSQGAVSVNGINADIVSWSSLSIKINIPDTPTGSGSVIVKTYNGVESSITVNIKEKCIQDTWECGNWGTCSSGGTQIRTCSKTSECSSVDTPSPATTQSCTPTPPPIDQGPIDKCDQITKNIKFWMDYDNSSINPEGIPFSPSDLSEMREARHAAAVAQIKNLLDLAKSYQCGSTKCTQDTWSCGNWGTCSPQGIQTRSCNKTYDCPSAETAAPGTAQYCQSSSGPIYQSPADTQAVKDQESIIRATVQLKCPSNLGGGEGGSGTIIDSKGTILTNKHLITNEQWIIDKAGCYVGFIDSYKDVPYFGDKQIADIYKVSANEDVALLKLRNPINKNLPSVDISQGNNNSLKPTDKLVIYGYPGIGGDTITVTPGYYNGVSGNYLKTDAKIAHGNSGGGAYTTSGIFMGVPTGAITDDITNLGYILSVNTINSWMNNTPIAYSPPSTNNYSRVASILENMTVDQINNFQIYAPGTEPTDSSQENKNEIPTNVIDAKLVNRLKGKILLQVESHGEAWYVNPADGKRYYMKDGPTAYEMMRKFGLGITNADLAKLPQENEANNYPSLVNRLKGKILLQVESVGEAWYVNPKTGYRHYMKDGAAAYNLMRFYSLGITNNDLNKIVEGKL